MNKILCFLLILVFAACGRSPYVEHKLQFEKVADNCTEQQSYFRMTSNFGGERFEFEKCLPAGFQKEQLKSERKGDTVLVRFPEKSTDKNVVYHITLDIDSYPRYGFITIDGDTYAIAPSQK